MKSKVNIMIVVNVIGALSDKTLGNKNLIMMDNSVWPSLAQGTANLCTLVQYGQQLNWNVVAVDLQTPVAIHNIQFFPAGKEGLLRGAEATELTDVLVDGNDKSHLKVWSGVVPPWMARGIDHRYRLTIKMSEGINSLMYIDTPSLRCI
jgi:hypothetical protein